MALVIGSADLSDDQFLDQLTRCTLPASAFRHGDHLRLAWILLHRYPFAEALERCRAAIKAFAAHLKADGLYHETITRAWLSLLATHKEASFEEFLSANQHRLNTALLHRFWRPETLATDAARASWSPPDSGGDQHSIFLLH